MNCLIDTQMTRAPRQHHLLLACIIIMALICALYSSPARAQSEVSVNTLDTSAVASQNKPSVITLPLNKVHVVSFDRSVRDVIIANPEIADVIVKTQTKAYIIGRSTGDTDILFVDQTGAVMNHIIARVDLDISAAAAAIRELVPSAEVELRSVNDSIVITGVVHTAKESADASTIAQQFVAEDSNVVNMLRVLGDQQVLLQVRIAEIQRNVLKKLGLSSNITFSTNKGPGSLAFDITTFGQDLASAFEAVGQFSTGAPNIPQTTYSALERQGLVKTLAEPVLTAISGESASFLVGGLIPTVGGVDSTGNTIIEFREFGVKLEFTPVVMAKDHISLRIATEVSRISTENSLTIPIQQGATSITITGLSVRKTESTVNLPSGGSLMIAGLLQNDEFTTIDGVPWLQNIPILGALFRSPSFQNNQSELVILVEAVLVRPTDNKQQLALPTDGFVSPSDFDLLILGRLFKQYGSVKNSDEVPIIGGPIGYFMP